MQLLNAKTEIRLSQATGLKVGRTDIPNNAPAIVDSLPALEAAAAALGIDFSETGFTFTVKVEEDGKRSIFSPQVGNVGDVPHLVWGRTATPLSNLPACELVQDGTTFAVFYLEDLDEPLEIRVRVKQDVKITDLKAAANKGKLADKLDRVIVPAMPLAELHKTYGEREYRFTAYELGSFKGKPTATVLVDGIGWVRANKDLAKALSSNPVVSAEQPASFRLRDTGKEMNDYKVFNTLPLHFSSITKDDLSNLGVTI